MGACPDTCGCRRTCPPKPRFAPPARRFASRRRGCARPGAARRYRFSQPVDRRRRRCRFVGRAPAGLTARLDVRVAPAEKEQLASIAATAGIAVAELVRLRALGRPVVSRTDATTIRELRRLGGLLKLVHVESGGAYRQQTAELLSMLRAAVGRLAAGEGGGTMIVKKVATSKRAPAKSKADNVRALADYIAGPNAGGDGEKVEHRGALNLLNLDHEGQVQEMIDLAEMAKRSPQPVQHWIMSWREGEQPTSAQADQAARMFLDEMGLAGHQALYGLHRDTENWHLHMAVNRVHPETEKLVTVNNGFDHEVAHRAIARIEHAQGWQREERGLFQVREDGRVERARPRDEQERKPSVRARDFEERVGARSAERVAIEDGAPAIRAAGSWREMHEVLAEKGMRFERKGSGAILWVGDQPVKASSAGRDCSMSALQKRLGEFEPARDAARVMTRTRDPEPIKPECSRLEAVHRGATTALPGAFPRTGTADGAAAGGSATHGRPPSAGAGRHLPRVVEGTGRSPQRDPERARRPSGAGKGRAA